MGLIAERVRAAKNLLRRGIFDDHWIFLTLEKLVAGGIVQRSRSLQREWSRVKKIFAR